LKAILKNLERGKNMELKIGMFTPANKNYWAQIPEMKNEIKKYASEIEKKLTKFGTVLNAGIIDDIDKARKAEIFFITNDIDILVIHAGTYGLSKNIIPAILRLNIPIITLHLQPVENFVVASASSYTLPKNAFSIAGELGNILNRLGKKHHMIFGKLYNDADVWLEAEEWFLSVRTIKRLRNANIGFLGNYYSGMCDLYVDLFQLIKIFGVNIEIIEIGDLRKEIELISEEEVLNLKIKLKENYSIDENAPEENILWNIKVALGMEKMVKNMNLHSLAYNYSGYSNSTEEKIAYSMTLGGSLLLEQNIPCAVEGDIRVAVPMLILKELKAGASQTEINVADFNENFDYISHSGPGDYSIANEKPYLRYLSFFHGKRGSGISSEFSIRNGPVTLLSMVNHNDNSFKFIVAEGESIKGEILKNGNVNTRVRFNGEVSNFIKEWSLKGPSHHSVICTGHQARILEIITKLYNLEFIKV
jgi:L-arabinose isomerase